VLPQPVYSLFPKKDEKREGRQSREYSVVRLNNQCVAFIQVGEIYDTTVSDAEIKRDISTIIYIYVIGSRELGT
jgi:hypothetical protein